MDDRPGGLHSVAQILSGAGINLEDAYGFVIQDKKRAVLVVEVEKIPEAVGLLRSRCSLRSQRLVWPGAMEAGAADILETVDWPPTRRWLGRTAWPWTAQPISTSPMCATAGYGG